MRKKLLSTTTLLLIVTLCFSSAKPAQAIIDPITGLEVFGAFVSLLNDVLPFFQSQNRIVHEDIETIENRAEKGDADAQLDLGLMYYLGEGKGKNNTKAEEWIRKAAEQGQAEAQFNLGFLYSNGISKDSEKSQKEAIIWYTKSAEQGNDSAQCNLGIAYAAGNGVQRDYNEAMRWLRKSATQGNATAQFNIGLLYSNGADELGLQKDFREAAEWFRKAATAGNVNAQYNLAQLYEDGNGIPKDDNQAFFWYHEAAERGNAEAQCKLGNMYAEGRANSWFFRRNFKEAAKWYRKASSQENAEATYRLACLYKDGYGIPQDYTEADRLYNKAKNLGYSFDADIESKIDNVISDDEISETDDIAKKLAELSDLEKNINQRESNITKRENELSSINEELSKRTKELEAKENAIPIREKELNIEKDKLEKESAKLLSKSQQLDQDKKQLSNYKIELQQREVRLNALSDDLKETQNKLLQDKKQLEEKELALSNIEDTLKQRKEELDNHETTLKDQYIKEIDMLQASLNNERTALTRAKENINSLSNTIQDANMRTSEAKNIAQTEVKRADTLMELNEKQQQEIEHLNAALATIIEMLINAQKNNDVITTTTTDRGQSKMNWSDNYIEAMGTAPLEQVNATNDAQARSLARRGAIVDLQRNLLETVKGVQIDAKTTLENYMTSDSVTSVVNGTIKGVEVFEEYDDGKLYIVKGRIYLNDIRTETVNSLKATKQKKSSSKKCSYTGLILDVRHLPLKPAWFLHIVDEQGSLVYSFDFADKISQGTFGLCAYYNKTIYAKDEFRVGENPMEVKALALVNGNTDIVISNNDAALIRGCQPDFRKNCRVIVVK